MTSTLATELHRSAAERVRRLGTILGVWAHPDDESYLSAGLMALATTNGQRVVVVHATLGELGTDDPVRWPPERLAVRRADELVGALAAVGVTERHHLGHLDGTCGDADPAQAAEPIARLITQIDPNTIVTFGPDGMTGHPDHRAVSTWVDHAWLHTGQSARVLHATVTPSWVARHEGLNRRLGVFGEGLPAAVAPQDLAVHLRLPRAVLDQKMRALAAHSSQTRPLMSQMSAVTYRNWWSSESFVDRRPR
jgi:LmbE family N-acetylglucosaminyl deacetylase